MRIDGALKRMKTSPDSRLALLFLDFDRFKIVNDTLGHEVGDQLLKEIASRIRGSIEAVDSISLIVTGNTAARLGGDEFVVLLENLKSEEDAQVVATHLLEVFGKPYILNGHEVFSTASIGIAFPTASSVNADDLIRDADMAMYEAKINGKNRLMVFDPAMRERLLNRMALERDLREALPGGQLMLMYQPIVSTATGDLDSVEALIRWNHPDRGLVSPADFIPIAEDTGLIIPIGEWVLEEACRQFMIWKAEDPARAPRTISVNLSRIQLATKELPHRLEQIFKAAGMGGAELVELIGRQLDGVPAIVITGHGTVELTKSCLKNGAVDLIEKPMDPDMLLDRVQSSIEWDAARRAQRSRREQVRRSFDTLSIREREVMLAMCRGLSSKQIGYELGISTRTVEKHRGKVMAKLHTDSLAHVVRIALDLQLDLLPTER